MLDAPPVELRLFALAVQLERPLVAHRVRTAEDPVLPGAEATEDPTLHRLPGEAEIRFHARERVRRERGALLDRDPNLVAPVDLIGRRCDEPELQRWLRPERLPGGGAEGAKDLRLAMEAVLESRPCADG